MWAMFTNVPFVSLIAKVVIFCWKENIFLLEPSCSTTFVSVRCWCNDICCVLHHDNLNAFYIFEAYEKPSLMLLLRSIACLSHPLDCDSYICYFSCTLHVIKENKNKYLYPYVVHKGAITSTIAWMKESTSR